jgi:hypothetical protein
MQQVERVWRVKRVGRVEWVKDSHNGNDSGGGRVERVERHITDAGNGQI